MDEKSHSAAGGTTLAKQPDHSLAIHIVFSVEDPVLGTSLTRDDVLH